MRICTKRDAMSLYNRMCRSGHICSMKIFHLNWYFWHSFRMKLIMRLGLIIVFDIMLINCTALYKRCSKEETIIVCQLMERVNDYRGIWLCVSDWIGSRVKIFPSLKKKPKSTWVDRVKENREDSVPLNPWNHGSYCELFSLVFFYCCPFGT